MLNISDNLKLPLEAVTQTFAILAKRGVGKTYTGAVMVEEMLAAKQQVVVADPIGVWWGLRSSADGKGDGFPIVVFGGEHADVPLEEHSGEVIAGAIVENGFSAILDLSLLRKGAQVRFMTAFAEALYRLNRKPLHLAVDEADAFAPQRPMKGEERLLGSFEDIVRRGRARGLGVTLITQRAAVLNKNVLTQIEVLIVLRTISPQDREAIETWTVVHGTPKQLEQLSESLASLPIGTAWFWSPGWLDVFKKVEVRQRITFDSSSTPKVGEKVRAPKQIAAVDLDQLGAQIKATAEKQKENDPRELKAEIGKLRAEISRLQKATPAAGEKIRQVPVLSKSDQKLMADCVEALSDVIQACQETVDEVRRFVTNSRPQHLLQLIQKFSTHDRGKSPLAPRAALASVSHLRADKVQIMSPSIPTANNSEISGGLRRMMIALAQRPGLNKRQLGVRAGLSSTSGTFGTYLGRLRSNGWVDGAGDSLSLTESGSAALGSYDPLPEGAELLNYWLAELGQSGAGRMLRTLAEVYPQGLTKEQLGERAEISCTSGTFGTYLGKLRTLELVEGRGEIRATREFFE
jgi:hypothetical protein